MEIAKGNRFPVGPLLVAVAGAVQAALPSRAQDVLAGAATLNDPSGYLSQYGRGQNSDLLSPTRIRITSTAVRGEYIFEYRVPAPSVAGFLSPSSNSPSGQWVEAGRLTANSTGVWLTPSLGFQVGAIHGVAPVNPVNLVIPVEGRARGPGGAKVGVIHLSLTGTVSSTSTINRGVTPSPVLRFDFTAPPDNPGLWFERVAPEEGSRFRVAVHYRLGNQQLPTNRIALAASLNGGEFAAVPAEDLSDAAGDLGSGVVPGLHGFVWDASAFRDSAETGASIVLRLTDDLGTTAFSDPVRLGCSDLAAACAPCQGLPLQVQAGTGSVALDLSLGTDGLGRSRGRLWIHEDRARDILGTPAALWREIGPGTAALPAGSDAASCRQLLGPAVLVDIADPDPADGQWTVRAYDRETQLGPFDAVSGLHDQSAATPFQTVTCSLERDGGGAIQAFLVAEAGIYGARTHRYGWNPDASGQPGWVLEETDPARGLLRREQVLETTSPDGLTVTTDRRVLEPDGTLSGRAVTEGRTFPFGERVVREERFVVQPDGTETGSRVTRRIYGETAGEPGYGQLLESYVEGVAESWTAYAYGPDGVAEIRRPYQDAGRGADPSDLDVTTVTWHRADFGLGPAEDLASVTTRSLVGQTVSRTVEVSFRDVLAGTTSGSGEAFEYEERWSIVLLDLAADTVPAALASPGALVTKTRTYASGPFAGETRSVLSPDGTITIFEPGPDGSVTAWSGVATPDGHGITAGLRLEETVNAHGHLLTRQTVALPQDLVVAEEVALAHDPLGRPTRIRSLDGSEATRTYDCCGLAAETDRTGLTTTFARDSLGRLRSATRLGVTTSWELGALGQVRAVTRTAAGTTGLLESVVADSLGLVSSRSDASGRTWLRAESRDGDGLLTVTEVNPDGGTVVRLHQADGRLRSVTGTAARPRRFVYGTDGPLRVTREIFLGSAGEETEWIATSLDPAGRVIKRLRSHERGAPAETTFAYDARGRLERVTDPDGVVTWIDSDALGDRVVSALDRDGDGAIGFGGTDRIVETVSTWSTRDGVPVRRATERVWSAAGDPDPADFRVTEASADGRQRWDTVAGLVTHTVTEPLGDGRTRTTVTFPDGTREITEAEGGRPVRETGLDADGTEIRRLDWSHDPFGRLASRTEARTGTTETFAWGDDDRPLSRTLSDPGDGLGPRVTAFTHDAAGRLDRTVFPDGSVLDRDWSPAGDLVGQSGDATFPVTVAYDAQGRLLAMTGAAGTTTWERYPESGRLARKLDGAGRGPSYAYTAAGRLSRRISGRGIVSEFARDSAGDLVGIDYGDDTPDLAYVRDRRGRVVSVASAGSVTAWELDLLGSARSETVTGGPLDGVAWTFGRDALSRRMSWEVAGLGWSRRQEYAYDATGRVSRITSGGHEARYGYLPGSDRVTSVAVAGPDGDVLATTRLHDAWDRLLSVANAAGAWEEEHVYRLDLAGRRDRVRLRDGSGWDFAYDPRGQLTGAVRRRPDGNAWAGGVFAYAYDDAGSRTFARYGVDGTREIGYGRASGDGTQWASVTHPGIALVLGEADPAAAVTVDGTPVARRQAGWFAHELALDNQAGPAARPVAVAASLGDETDTETRRAFVPAALAEPEYDADGNLVFDGFLEYAWDAENRLVSVGVRAGRAPPGSGIGFRQAFAYDHAGRRVRRQEWRAVGNAEVLAADEVFLHDGRDRIAVLDASSRRPRQTYAWGVDLSGTLGGAGGAGGLWRVTDHAGAGGDGNGNGNDTGTSHVPAFDGNGNVIALVDAATGALGAVYGYDPFGQVLTREGPFAERNPWRFGTRPQDPLTGHYAYAFRDYDPSHGRWLNRDPLGEAAGQNLYGFVGNDPVNAVDVWGLIESRVTRLSDAPNAGATQFITYEGDAFPPVLLLRDVDGDEYGFSVFRDAMGDLQQVVFPRNEILRLYDGSAWESVAHLLRGSRTDEQLAQGAIDRLTRRAQDASCPIWERREAVAEVSAGLRDARNAMAGIVIGAALATVPGPEEVLILGLGAKLSRAAKAGRAVEVPKVRDGGTPVDDVLAEDGGAKDPAQGVTNALPSILARVIPEGVPATTLGRPGAPDVFVTAADDIVGMNAAEIAVRLTIPGSPSGFRIFEFPTPQTGVASPVFRPDPGFIDGGRTGGGAREFVIPNGPIPPGSTIRTVR
jgi:RHS repeat-associated protein